MSTKNQFKMQTTIQHKNYNKILITNAKETQKTPK